MEQTLGDVLDVAILGEAGVYVRARRLTFSQENVVEKNSFDSTSPNSPQQGNHGRYAARWRWARSGPQNVRVVLAITDYK